MPGIDKNIDIFNFLRSNLILFQPKSANISLKADRSMSSILVERLPSFWFQNDSKSRHRLYKNEDVEFF